MSRIVIVDDDPAILRALTRNLEARGHTAIAEDTGRAALDQIEHEPPDLIVLDLMLPDISGIELCKRIRRHSAVPILILSARGEERAKVMALDDGADDYLTKPFGMDELLARVRALLRRQPAIVSDDAPISVGGLEIDVSSRRAALNGQTLDLTAREFDVLAFLARHHGKIVTHRQLLREVWGREYGGETQYLRVFVNRVRRKLETDAAKPRWIITDPGIGYRLVDPE
jgi:two-component system KDP operon response regulator KdpE